MLALNVYLSQFARFHDATDFRGMQIATSFNAKTHARFTAGITLIGTIVGSLAGVIPHALDYKVQQDAANAHQVEVFTDTVRPASGAANGMGWRTLLPSSAAQR